MVQRSRARASKPDVFLTFASYRQKILFLI